MKNSFLSALAGWLAGLFFIPLISGSLFESGGIFGILYMALYSAPIVLLVWLVALWPLYTCVPKHSILWHPALCICCGAVAGTLPVFFFFSGPSAGMRFFLAPMGYFGGIIGGVTCAVGCVLKRREKRANPRLYRYVGPAEIRQTARRESHCRRIDRREDLLGWTKAHLPEGRHRGIVPATFILDTNQKLWIADRHSEHVACADGQDVLAAGEIFFDRSWEDVSVAEITNQSTGYCPEPECWEVIADVLDRLRIDHPDYFTSVFHFRRCGHCGNTNLIKERVFECAVCQSPLSQSWNYAWGG